MKQLYILVLVLLLLLTACVPQSVTTATKELPQSSQTESFYDPVDGESLLTSKERAFLQSNLPRLDGSTSLIPYEASVRSALMGIGFEESSTAVKHSSTWDSFYNFLGGKADMIFTCPLSQEQYEMLKDKGRQIEEIPVTMEAFVFVVNAENPVDSLTQEQIRDIYSGKITNWKQVGGNDAPIAAYQRNSDSGSQNFMIDFMKDVPLMEPPKEQVAGLMGVLMDVVAINDNAVNSIGYSVYSYAADMYENSNLTKFIKVDGVAPSRSTMNDRTYPLLGYNYAVYDKGAATDSAVALLAKYLLSYEAQSAAAEAGYVPVIPIDYDFTAHANKTPSYQGEGKGGKAPEGLSFERYGVDNATSETILAALKDRRLAESVQSVMNELASQGHSPTLAVYNGYLAVNVQQGYSVEGFEVRVWDLYTGKRLSFEELFYEGVDVDETMNALVCRSLFTEWELRLSPYELDVYFATKENAHWKMNFTSLCYEKGDYVEYNEILSEPVFVFQTPRDMEGLFGEDVGILKSSVSYSLNQAPTKVPQQGSVIYLLREDVYPKAKEINEKACDIIAQHFQKDRVEEESLKINPAFEWFSTPTWNCTQYQGRLAIFSNREYRDYNRLPQLFFDLESGRQLSWEDLFYDGWKEALSDQERALWEIEGASVCDVWTGSVTLRYPNNADPIDEYAPLTEETYIVIPEAYRKY